MSASAAAQIRRTNQIPDGDRAGVSSQQPSIAGSAHPGELFQQLARYQGSPTQKASYLRRTLIFALNKYRPWMVTPYGTSGEGDILFQVTPTDKMLLLSSSKSPGAGRFFTFEGRTGIVKLEIFGNGPKITIA